MTKAVIVRAYRTTPKQRAASARWYAKNRRRHIDAVRARYRARVVVGGSFGPSDVTVAQARERAAAMFGTVQP